MFSWCEWGIRKGLIYCLGQENNTQSALINMIIKRMVEKQK